ncbi:penicillin-binding protein [Alkalihalophilus marmarensis]|uniref:Penicillin-binding protein 4 n=1 Tax=Alkalihalophilus marmarensis DSM 21297 TaxID=1188261 RepID=U6SHV6_9BACI|nr:transglycosylase domain-containing protein [Alkalihalophilus marmarensis]ERN51158.1 penicillin-binding protein 4 [Alkalihalophilus marmarensis DSM 21297]MCM3491356.1 penicillin-binding protein [Alkalihalophilus marmarensis]
MKTLIGWFLIILMLFGFSFLFMEAAAEIKDIQTLSEVFEEHVAIDTIELSSNSYMYDKEGQVISEIYNEGNREYIEYEDIPKVVIDAFIQTEDRRFFDHKGYDGTAIIRALVINAKSSSIEEGASTMTQQLARNVFLSHEQSYNRKLSELLYAHEIEKQYSKEEIIELYLNTIYFQNGVYGFEAASQFYFGRTSSELTLAEVAFLSAVPNNPTHYDPIKNSQNTNLRKDWIIEKMLEAEVITIEEADQARKQQITITPKKRIDLFPDYVTYIHYELKELIAETDGFNRRLSSAASAEQTQAIERELNQKVEKVLQSGVHIDTALDPAMQKRANDVIANTLPQTDIQATAVMIDHLRNELVGITAGKAYQKFDFHRGYQMYRQPGSAIKPILVYAPYMEESGVPLQSSINANNFCSSGYCPKNYGGGQYGNVSLMTAFKHSYNTPAVRILDRVGIETAFTYLDTFGFKEVTKEDHFLPAALGGFTYGMSPLELTRSYTPFGRNGQYAPAYGIRSVKSDEGDILYSWEAVDAELWSPETNDKMRTLLREVVKSGTGRRASISSNYVGGKTGTTNDYHDMWFIGLNDQYTTGVWIGKDRRESLSAIYGNSPHLTIWREIMK